MRAVLLTLFLDVLAYSMIAPLLPFYVRDLAGDGAATAWLSGMLGAGYAVMQLISGPILGTLSDRRGRRPILLACQAGRDQRSRAVGRLHHNRAEREPRDDSIAAGEGSCVGRREGRDLAHQGSLPNDLQGKVGMLGRIDLQYARPEDGDRSAAGVESAAVGGMVDPPGQAADDGVAGAGQAAGQLVGHPPPVGRRMP